MWNLQSEIWTLESEIWNLNYEIRNLKFKIWNLKSEIWNMVSGIWNLNSENWKLEPETWKLKSENWKLEAGVVLFFLADMLCLFFFPGLRSQVPLASEVWKCKKWLYLFGFLQVSFRNSSIYQVFWQCSAEITVFKRFCDAAAQKSQYLQGFLTTKSEIWNLKSGIWNLKSEIWNL